MCLFKLHSSTRIHPAHFNQSLLSRVPSSSFEPITSYIGRPIAPDWQACVRHYPDVVWEYRKQIMWTNREWSERTVCVYAMPLVSLSIAQTIKRGLLAQNNEPLRLLCLLTLLVLWCLVYIRTKKCTTFMLLSIFLKWFCQMLFGQYGVKFFLIS